MRHAFVISAPVTYPPPKKKRKEKKRKERKITAEAKYNL
jgi:hypothetical protein